MPKIPPSESKKSMPERMPQLEPADVQKKRVDAELKPSKIEVMSESCFRIKFYLLQVGDGDKFRRYRVVRTDDAQNFEEGVLGDLHWVEFKMWTYKQEMDLKRKCMQFDEQTRMNFINNDLLNRLKIQLLLSSWSLDEKFGIRLKLFHQNGVLVDESYEMFVQLFPNIIRFILSEMNDVLEYNG